MFPIIGWLVVLGCVAGGYAGGGGHFGVLWQPFEYLIILGSSVGAFIVANPKHVLGAAGKGLAVRIGAHSDRLWSVDSWRRFPEVSFNQTLTATETITAHFPVERHGLFRFWDVRDAADPLENLAMTAMDAVEVPQRQHRMGPARRARVIWKMNDVHHTESNIPS